MRNRMACLAWMLFAGPAIADEKVTATGRVLCFDGSVGSARPLEGIRVELMDSDCDGSQICDDVMGVAYAGADGTFEVAGTGGDPFGGRPDVYLRFAYNDDRGVRLTDEADTTRSFNTPEHEHDDTGSGTVAFGEWTTGLGVEAGEGTRCGVWLASRTAYRAYVAEAGAEPPAGHLDVLYWSAIWAGTPWTNTDTIHWPIHYASSAARHEFGHSIRHAADGDPAHFALDVGRFRYARNHSRCASDANAQPGESRASVEGFGFNEGWAEYWAGDTSGCPGLTDDAIEGRIAFDLRGLQRAHGLERRDMARVLIDNAGSIHTLEEYRSALASRLGVSSSSLRVESDGQADPRALWTGAMAADRVASGLRRHLSEVRAGIEARTRAAREIAARNRLNRNVVCVLAECERVFRDVTAPALLEAETRVLESFALLLERALGSPDALPARLASGEFERWLAEQRGILQAELRAVMEKGLDAARVALGRAGPRLGHHADAFLGELTEARTRLAASAGGQGARGPTLPELRLGEDLARRAP